MCGRGQGEKKQINLTIFLERLAFVSKIRYNRDMLVETFPKLESWKIVRLMRAFFRSPVFVVIVAMMMAAAELFSLEKIVYIVYVATVGVILLVCEDSLPMLCITCCCYMCVSAKNNPGIHFATSIFAQPSFIVLMGTLLVFAIILMIARVVLSLLNRPKRSAPKLFFGFLVLGLAYMLGGIGSGFYSTKTLLFGFVQIVSIALVYFFFYFTVDWENTPEHYGLTLFFAIGVGILFQVVGMYLNAGDISNWFTRSVLYTGWGVYNNVGCVLVMCMPAPFYFAAKRKNGWLYSLVGSLFFVGVIFTQSRASILMGAIVFLACIIFMLVKSSREEKIKHLVFLVVLLSVLTVVVFIFRNQIIKIFNSLVEAGFDDSNRFSLYKACIDVFLKNPIFGVGFYRTPGAVIHDGWAQIYPDKFGNFPEGLFMPPRAHNTIMQLIATGGAFALIAYLVHRVETLILLFRRPTSEKTMLFFCVAGLLLTSYLDCHFFNIGPGILYSALLVCMEGAHRKRSLKVKSVLKTRANK